MAFKFFILLCMIIYCGLYLQSAPALAQDGMRPWRPFPPELKTLPLLGPPPQPWAPIPEPRPGRWSNFNHQSDLPEQHLLSVNPHLWVSFHNFKNFTEQSYRPAPSPPPERFSAFPPQGDMPELRFQSLPPEKPWRWRDFAPFMPMR